MKDIPQFFFVHNFSFLEKLEQLVFFILQKSVTLFFMMILSTYFWGEKKHFFLMVIDALSIMRLIFHIHRSEKKNFNTLNFYKFKSFVDMKHIPLWKIFLEFFRTPLLIPWKIEETCILHSSKKALPCFTMIPSPHF